MVTANFKLAGLIVTLNKVKCFSKRKKWRNRWLGKPSAILTAKQSSTVCAASYKRGGGLNATPASYSITSSLRPRKTMWRGE